MLICSYHPESRLGWTLEGAVCCSLSPAVVESQSPPVTISFCDPVITSFCDPVLFSVSDTDGPSFVLPLGGSQSRAVISPVVHT